MKSKEIDGLVDRLEALLVHAAEALRAGQLDDTKLFIEELMATAKRLPQKPNIATGTPQAPCRERSNECGLHGECLRCGAYQGEACRHP